MTIFYLYSNQFQFQFNFYQYQLIFQKMPKSQVYKIFLNFKLISFQIQMTPIILISILELFITKTVQNLIRFGDFQNLIPPQPQEVVFINCDAYCDGIWYTTSPSSQIQLLLNAAVPGKSQKTTAADMVFDYYIQLCQDFKAPDIGKTYQYTFDMHCFLYSNIESCSIWVILNGQSINGTNHTHTDKLVHHNVGYINITSQNNTICFQSRQVPYVQYCGTEIDNITLQIFNAKTPCNVFGCQFCKLNFPNVCQVCQYPFIPEGSSCRCQFRFYLNEKICKICLFPCETCQGQARNCLSCSNSYRLQGNQCVIAEKWALAASIIASVPGIQFFSIGQTFLGISDQFWPYYSHHRVYGNQTIEILTFFHTLQNNKWFLLGLDKKINFNFQSLNFSDYSTYSNQQFLKMESKTSYFWDGAFEILFFSFPTMLLVFFFFNKIFYLTFEYRISRHFRPFSFLLMIYFLGIGEDISYLSFLSFSNGMNLFFFKFQDKLGHIAWILVFFLLVLFFSGGYFAAKIIYKKLCKHFIGEFFPKLQSLHILSCSATKAFMIGSLNALLARNYEALIICLGLIEVVFLIGVIYIQWRNRCHKIQTFMFLQMLKSIIMTFFNVSLWIDWKMRVSQQAQTEQQRRKLLDFNCKALVIVIIGLGVLEAISTYFSGRKALNDTRQKQVPKMKKCQRQTLKIINIKQNAQVKQKQTVKQQMRAKKDYFYKNKTLEKAEKTQKSKKIKIKCPLKKESNELRIIRQQDGQDELPFELIIINGWNNT